MSNINDDKILELRKQIEVKKSKLSQMNKYNYLTNLVLDFEGEKYNLNVMRNIKDLNTLLIRLNMYKLSALDLKIDCIISGYDVCNWMDDIKAKIDLLSRKAEEDKLKQMEERLVELLSNEKKVELEINEMQEWLK